MQVIFLVSLFLFFSCSVEESKDSNTVPSSASESSSSSEIPPSSSSEKLSSSSNEKPSSSSIQISSSSSVFSSSSVAVSSSSSDISCIGKACIDAEIDENWERLGYSSKPTKVIALSFDDGPCSQTQSLLTALKNKEVKTTFFLIGQNIRNNQAAAQAIYTDGHELANHSDGYDNLGSSANAESSLQSCNNEIKKITGENATLFRAPSVNYGTQLTQACTNLNLPLIDVSCWSNDYNGLNSTQIRNNVKACAGDGKIVNLHEFNTATGNNAAGIEGLIDDLRSAGYWILPVGEMAVYKSKTLVGGQQYSGF